MPTPERDLRETVARLLHRFDCEDGAPEEEGPDDWDSWWDDPRTQVNRPHYMVRADLILAAFARARRALNPGDVPMPAPEREKGFGDRLHVDVIRTVDGAMVRLRHRNLILASGGFGSSVDAEDHADALRSAALGPDGEEVEELRFMLWMYGYHIGDCPAVAEQRGECSCGWDKGSRSTSRKDDYYPDLWDPTLPEYTQADIQPIAIAGGGGLVTMLYELADAWERRGTQELTANLLRSAANEVRRQRAEIDRVSRAGIEGEEGGEL